jgi:diguanylate cyclase (GGDEF)-like protein/PAS domain S-box-containing protein
MMRSRRRDPFLIECALVGFVAIMLTVMFGAHLGSARARLTASDVALPLAALGAAGSCLWRSRRCPSRVRQAWTLLGLAALSWGLGQTFASYYEVALHKSAPFPSPADIGYLIAVPLFAAGLLKVPGAARGLATRVRSLLDGLIIAASLLLISWVLVLGLVVHTGADTLFHQVIGLAYPVGDVVVATLVLHVWLRSRAAAQRPPLPLGVLGLALVGLSLADSGYYYLTTVSTYGSGSIIDSGWLCGFLLLLLAGRIAPRADAEQSDVIARSLGEILPYGAAVAAIVISAVEMLGSHNADPFLVVLRTVLVLGLVARQVMALAENRGLTRRLEQRVSERTAELRAGEKRFEALVKHSSDAVSLVDLEGRIRYQSESALAVLGYPAESLIGRQFSELLDEASRDRLLATIGQALQRPYERVLTELEICHADHHRLVETTVTNLVDQPSVQGLVLNTRDISVHRKLEDELFHQAFHDALTGLANRALFQDRVEHALARRIADGPTVAVLFLDLDGFKEINDSLGHASGDDLLVQIADRLRRCVRVGDTVARFGGDEFAVLMEEDGTTTTALAMAQRIIGTFDAAYTIGGREMTVRTSVGIATADSSITNIGQLLRNADLAMYRAKSAGGGTFVDYDPEMHHSLVERLELERELRQAVRERTIEVHYQPTIAINTEKVVGFEALARWRHPERGYIPPTTFIPLAEQTDLIHDLGRIVLETACCQLVGWQSLDGVSADLSMSVNISGHQLQRYDFVETVAEVIEHSGINPACLVLEITEGMLVGDTEGALLTLQRLKELGIRLAIDDFGTGYSSLSYLHRFPIDVLKIDKSFVDRLGNSMEDEEVVSTILQLGTKLRMTTVAEGIEDYRQALALRRLGCELAQGFHYSRPVPADEIHRLLVGVDMPEMTGAA